MLRLGQKTWLEKLQLGHLEAFFSCLILPVTLKAWLIIDTIVESTSDRKYIEHLNN
jgi:hypothetical protein